MSIADSVTQDQLVHPRGSIDLLSDSIALRSDCANVQAELELHNMYILV